MRLNEVIGYTTEEILAELNRRGFLKGLGGAAAIAAIPSMAKAADSSKVKSAMDRVMKADKMITGYTLRGETLIVKVNNDRKITDISKFGFDDNYAKEIAQLAGVKKVVFDPAVDEKSRPVTSQLSDKGKEMYYRNPEKWGDAKNPAPFTLRGQADAIGNALDAGNLKQACFHTDAAMFIASREGNKDAYQKLAAMKSRFCK